MTANMYTVTIEQRGDTEFTARIGAGNGNYEAGGATPELAFANLGQRICGLPAGERQTLWAQGRTQAGQTKTTAG